MLEDLKILNGELSLKFDSLNTIYTINVAEDIESLELEYRLKDNTNISIIGNDNFQLGINEVVITVYNDEASVSYYLYVYKENTSTVFAPTSYSSKKEVEELWEYAVPVISTTCFLIILFTFCLLFRKKRR